MLMRLLLLLLRSTIAQTDATPQHNVVLRACNSDAKMIGTELASFDAATAAEREARLDTFCDLIEKGLACCQWGECFDTINGTQQLMERRDECRRAIQYNVHSDAAVSDAASTGMPTATAVSSPQAGNPTAPMTSLVGLVPYGGVVLSNALYLSPMMSVRRAVKAGRLGSLNVVPQALMVVSTGAWLSYGFSLPNVFLLASNLGGSVLSVYYVSATLPLIPSGQLSDRQAVQAILVLGNAAMLLVWTVLVLSELARRTVSFVLGAYGSFLCVLLFAAPLSTARTVVASRSSASIETPLLAAQLANCMLWSVYGLLMIRDVWVWAPNLAGLTLAIIQLILKLMYPSAHPSAPAHSPVPNEDSDVEMLWIPGKPKENEFRV
jgi:solute carrier family 50 protein (sugar transporter)